MKKAKPDSVMEIDDLETLKALAEPTRMAIIESLHKPHSVTQLAEVLDVPRTRLYHHIKLLEAHGLIRTAETRQVGALIEKLYEPAADGYRPSEALLASTNLAERVEASLAGVLDTTRADLGRSLLREWDDELHTADRKQVSMSRSLGRMTPQRAEEFIGEFAELVERFCAEDDESEDARIYALTWVFYPSSRKL